MNFKNLFSVSKNLLVLVFHMYEFSTLSIFAHATQQLVFCSWQFFLLVNFSSHIVSWERRKVWKSGGANRTPALDSWFHFCFSYEWFYSDLLNLIVTNVTILVHSKSFSQNNFLAVLIRFSLLIESKYYLLLQLDDDNAMNI